VSDLSLFISLYPQQIVTSISVLINEDMTMKDKCQENRSPSGLRLIRLLKGISQDEIAVRAGVDQAIVSRAERGLRSSPAARRKIAAILGMSEEALFPKRQA
jgi:predicted transcriptional regulator